MGRAVQAGVKQWGMWLWPVLLLLWSPSVFSQDETQGVDIAYVNGHVLTMDASDTVAQAVAVDGESIQAVGSNADIRALIGINTRVVDLAGKTLLPGFIDAHGHFPESGIRALYQVDLASPPVGSVNSIADLLDRLRDKAQRTPKGQWIQGVGYDDTLLAEKRHPTCQELDQVSTEHPIFLLHVSFHLVAVNSLALEHAQIDETTPDPPGGIIHRQPETQQPNGVLEESALFRVLGIIPPLSLAQSLDGIAVAAKEYAAKGVTTAQTGFAGGPFNRFASLVAAAEQGRLPIRVVVWPALQPFQEKPPDSPKLKVGAIKILADGSIQGYTGYLRKPYAVPPQGKGADYVGYPAREKQELITQVQALHSAGHQLAIHGNGDAAIDMILEAYRAAQETFPRQDARHVIIHAQMTQEDQLDAMKELGVIPSFFSLHTYYWGDRHRDIFMGQGRAYRMSPAKSARQRKMRFTIHADAPVVPIDPLMLVWAAVNRISTGGDIIGAEQRITPLEALRAITIDAAWQHFDEKRLGSIEPGKLADLVILSENPLRFPLHIKDIRVLETIVGGESVYKDW